MHRTLNILDADQSLYSGLVDAQTADLARYLKLNAGLARVDLDPDFAIPHIDAAARARAERNASLAAWDGFLAGLAVIAGTAAFSAFAAGAVLVIGGAL